MTRRKKWGDPRRPAARHSPPTRVRYAPKAPVAQLDRVSASEAEGRRFNSCRARQTYQGLTLTRRPFCFDYVKSVSSMCQIFQHMSLTLIFT